MKHLDEWILRQGNEFSQGSWTFDSLLVFLADSTLLKGGVIIILFWWAWFRPGNASHAREKIVGIFFGSLIAIAVARVMALTLPFRTRPLHNPDLGFILPYEMPATAVEGWSAFPSDHAVLYYALAAGLFLVSRRIGIFALIYTTLFIGLPRIYLGLHYPTDIIGGALIGVVFTYLSSVFLVGNTATRFVVARAESHPQLFYPLFFLFTYQIADLFTGVREVLGYADEWFRHIVL